MYGGNMTVEDIKELCPKAENIAILNGIVSMKVGEFAKSESMWVNKSPMENKAKITRLYQELLTMNRTLNDDINRQLNKNLAANTQQYKNDLYGK